MSPFAYRDEAALPQNAVAPLSGIVDKTFKASDEDRALVQLGTARDEADSLGRPAPKRRRNGSNAGGALLEYPHGPPALSVPAMDDIRPYGVGRLGHGHCAILVLRNPFAA
jgi:hypothetical protein